MEWYHYLIALGGAFIAGSINTLAGNGSVITLSILTELVGLPGNVANGTNRIGVLFNGIGGTWGFFRGRKLVLKGTGGIVICVVLGAVAGGFIAIKISDAQFMTIFKYLMIGMLIVVIIHPSRWMIEQKMSALVPEWVTYVIYFILGIYGGLIQMGMGIFFLAALVLLNRYPMIESNALKVFVVTVYTLLIVALFHFRGMVEWPVGLLMGIGQFAGGWATARTISKYPGMNKVAYYFLIAIILLSLASLFRLV
ncbi:MAG TPA: sulfite exporter TauE/SafE family protein [Saprospiraceae bacterium]|nr:sulfite exporter TauE/SafE family protein [Saprospiraceae bacterium]